MEQENNFASIQPPAPAPTAPFFPAQKTEAILFGVLLILGICICNSLFFAGVNLGFSLFSFCGILAGTGYLLHRGHRLTGYCAALLILSLIICASFARSDDGFVKFVLFCFLLLGVNLGMCLLSGQNRRDPMIFSSLLDAPRVIFMLGIGRTPAALRGLRRGLGNSGKLGKGGSAIGLGLVLAIPVLAIVIPLLMRADQAFEQLLLRLPQWDLTQILVSLVFGIPTGLFLYTRSAALAHQPKVPSAERRAKGLPLLTVNTVLLLTALVYAAYLFSQLAYFSGGFSGILPEGYTAAQYARRGFFEMAWLCAINLTILALGVGLVSGKEAAPLSTRLLCLFLGLVTLFIAVSASAKMFLYIGSFGLTRLRALTQVVIWFLALATGILCLWLFVPRLPYMKVILLAALVMGAAVGWADVDTVVARYNVTAYQQGRLETVDVWYLNELGAGATPYIAALQKDSDPIVAEKARDLLSRTYFDVPKDFRSWNYVNHVAKEYFPLPGDLAIPKEAAAYDS